MYKGVKSENIVIAALSQGGVLTFWTALYTKYKLGGFIAFVTWLPLKNANPVTEIQSRPVNLDTPFLQINGYQDYIVPYQPAGQMTQEEMKKVFKRYELKQRIGTHLTAGPSNQSLIHF